MSEILELRPFRRLRRAIIVAAACACTGNPALAAGADCNGNGVDDGVDITAGTSTDCDLNTQPDECNPPGMFEDFEGYAAGADPAGWFDTRANNSLLQDDSLFAVADFGDTKALRTTSTLTNIHSHYVDCGSEAWSAIRYTGRMRISDTNGGIGVTFMSAYPDQPAYYRLRRHQWQQAFRMEAAGTIEMICTPNDLGVIPSPGVWYRFRIETWNATDRTEIRGKMWEEGADEPAAWQAECYDDTADRLTSGTVGVWSMGPGEKAWDDLRVQPAFDCDGDGVPEGFAGDEADCNTNGVEDACEISSGAETDCDGNGVLDSCDIAIGTSPDCNGNGVPDACDFSGAIVGWGNGAYGQDDIPAGEDYTEIAIGGHHALAIRADGSLVGWGYNYYGQADPPPGGRYTAIAGGLYHSLALRADGSLVGWGYNNFGQTDVPAGNNYTAIAAGRDFCLALRTDGSLVGWGHNVYGQVSVPEGNDYISVAANGDYSLALRADGSLVGWGYNYAGQTDVPSGVGYVAIAAGWSHGLALHSDGSLVGWGGNAVGQTNVPAGTGFVAIACGYDHSLALRTDGSVAGWGYDTYGQASPPPGNDFAVIAAGHDFSLALERPGNRDCNGNRLLDDCELAGGTTEDCNGNGVPDECEFPSDPDCNSNGVLDDCDPDGDGDGSIDDCDNCPQAYNVDQSDADSDGVGDSCDICTDLDGDGLGDPGFPANTCPDDPCPDDPSNDADSDGVCGAIDNCPDHANADQADCDGDGVGDICTIANCAGDSSCGDCNGNTVPDACDLASNSAEDCNHTGLIDSCEIAAGTSSDCNNNGAPDNCDLAGAIVGWGYNGHGQTTIPERTDFSAVAAGGYHSVALLLDGSLVSWGYNSQGQTIVPPGDDFVAAAAGDYHSLALRSDGSLVGWGGNEYGETDVPPGTDFAAIDAGAYFSLALRVDGSLIGWGQNNYGRTDVPAGNDFIAIACGAYHNVALRADGSLSAWGNDDFGQTDVPTGNDFTAIAAGGYHSLALRSNGSLVAWGRSTFGETDVPALTGYVDMDAGYAFSVGLLANGSLVAWGRNDNGQTNVPTGNDFTSVSAGLWYALAMHSIESVDCNGNGRPDECDLTSGSSADINHNAVPDECDADCNLNAVPDDWEISEGTSADCNTNGVPDSCEVALGFAADCDSNGVPDSCDKDCDSNGQNDICEIVSGSANDCNGNWRLDSCEIAGGTTQDCDSNGVPDECDTDCNSNGIADACEDTLDCNSNGVPDECETDCNSNGVPDDCELPALVAELSALDAEDGDYFGAAVALDEGLAVIGARLEYGSEGSGGAAYVYRFDGTNWLQEAKLTASDRAPSDFFGTSVAVHGAWIAVGADGVDGGPDGTEYFVGAVYLFRFDGTAWTETTKLANPGASAYDFFGGSVALSDDLLVIGALRDDEGAEDAGAAYVYRYNGATWSLEAKLIAPDPRIGGEFGKSVATDNGAILIGAPSALNGSGQARGAGYYYVHDGSQWTFAAKLTASEQDSVAELGETVSLSGDVAVLGAPSASAFDRYDGAAYVFRFDGTAWHEEAQLIDPHGVSYDQLGQAVAASGDMVLVGVKYRDGAAANTGTAYLYRWTGTTWQFDAKLELANGTLWDYFGTAVALSGNTGLVGAFGRMNAQGIDDSGAAYVYEFTGSDCNGNGIPDDCDPDCDSDGLPDACELDCNGNDIPDDCDIADGASLDCNGNHIPDECDIAESASGDCNDNAVPDECDIVGGTSTDCNTNAIPDDCEEDCNRNGVGDTCDILGGTSSDCDGSGVPDECKNDCNANGQPDVCDIAAGLSEDCNTNGFPDECEIGGSVLLREDFDTYIDGSELHGVGGWKGWDNNPAAGAPVSSTHSLSPGHSVEIAGSSDLVHEFSGATSGVWILSAWQYIPSSFSGWSYFIVLNTYNDSGAKGWSTQIVFERDAGVTSPADSSAILPLIFDEWVELRLRVDLDRNLQWFYYGGTLLYSDVWAGGQSGGAPDPVIRNIGALDLYANGASSVFYDDVALTTEISDCNSNGVPDECDLAAGTSTDQNSNGLPDECDRRVYVDASAGGANDGSSWANAYIDLQDALAAPYATDIWVAEGTYRPGGDGDATSASFGLPPYVAVRGGFAGWEAELTQRDIGANKTILSGDLAGDDGPGFANRSDNSRWVVRVFGQRGRNVLDGCVVRGGYAQAIPQSSIPLGGALQNERGTLAVSQCTFVDNYGCVENVDAEAEYRYCVFVDNESLYGGGVSCRGSDVSLSQCVFEGNSAIYGGGLYATSYSTRRTKLKMHRCAFVNNRATSGGGVYAYGTAACELSQCRLEGNKATYGGGMESRYCVAVLANCTVVGNEATSAYGGGLVHDYHLLGAPDSDAVAVNCIFWENASSNGMDTGADAQLQLSSVEPWNIRHCCIQDDDPDDEAIPFGGAANGNIDDDPRFVGLYTFDPGLDMVARNLRLRRDSPCVDAGSNGIGIDGVTAGAQPLPAHDLDDHVRLVGDHVDMGAYEIQERGDLDGNGAVDLLDYGIFAACLSGPRNPLSADYDGDGDVDASDDAGWAECVHGPAYIVTSDCRVLDMDADEDVDLRDYGLYQMQRVRPLSPLPLGCEAIDADFDLDVDLADFSRMQCLLGAGN